MGHSEFVEAWNKGQLAVDVSWNLAVQAMNWRVIPLKYLLANNIWSRLFMLSIAVGLCMIYWVNLWSGVSVLILGTFLLGTAIKHSSVQFMIDYSLENEEFYEMVTACRLLTIRPKIPA